MLNKKIYIFISLIKGSAALLSVAMSYLMYHQNMVGELGMIIKFQVDLLILSSLARYGVDFSLQKKDSSLSLSIIMLSVVINSLVVSLFVSLINFFEFFDGVLLAGWSENFILLVVFSVLQVFSSYVKGNGLYLTSNFFDSGFVLSLSSFVFYLSMRFFGFEFNISASWIFVFYCFVLSVLVFFMAKNNMLKLGLVSISGWFRFYKINFSKFLLSVTPNYIPFLVFNVLFYIGPDAAGVYRVIERSVQLIGFPANILSSNIIPSARKINGSDNLTMLSYMRGILGFSFCFSIFGFLFMFLYLYFWDVGFFNEYFFIILLASFGQLVNSFFGPSGAILVAVGLDVKALLVMLLHMLFVTICMVAFGDSIQNVVVINFIGIVFYNLVYVKYIHRLLGGFLYPGMVKF